MDLYQISVTIGQPAHSNYVSLGLFSAVVIGLKMTRQHISLHRSHSNGFQNMPEAVTSKKFAGSSAVVDKNRSSRARIRKGPDPGKEGERTAATKWEGEATLRLLCSNCNVTCRVFVYVVQLACDCGSNILACKCAE